MKVIKKQMKQMIIEKYQCYFLITISYYITSKTFPKCTLEFFLTRSPD